MAAGSSTVEEPLLTISRPPRFWGSPWMWSFVVTAVVAVFSVVVFVVGILQQPPDSVVTLKGVMGSKAEFFEDPVVRDLLLRHGFRVEVTERGSREAAREVIANPDRYDFAFPSGQPAADLIKDDRADRKLYNKVTRLFTSPMVLVSFREYADTLANHKVKDEYVATAQHTSGSLLYYTLDMALFVNLGERQMRWNDIGISKHMTHGEPTTNGNQVLATTAGVCKSNHAATYLALIAFVKNGNRAPNKDELKNLTPGIMDLFSARGLTDQELFLSYKSPEGRSQGPIFVVYEHQYFAYQLEHLRTTGKLDTDRVLLYPKQRFQTDPEFIALREGPADRLASLLKTNSKLQRRMKELGYRVLNPENDSIQLFDYLTDHHVPTPVGPNDHTSAHYPTLGLLEKLIKEVGGCPDESQNAGVPTS